MNGKRHSASVLLFVLQCVYSEDVGKCSKISVRPKLGLCSGYTFTNNICTGDSPKWYQFDYQTLSDRYQLITAHLESYMSVNCTPWICKERLGTPVSIFLK